MEEAERKQLRTAQVSASMVFPKEMKWDGMEDKI